MYIKPIVLLCTCLFAGALDARDDTDPYWDYRDPVNKEFDYDDSKDVPWKEGGTALPPLPADENLVEVPLTGLPENLTAYTELSSIALSERDEVTRYWLIIKGKDSGYNATYEGLRCTTFEYKVYAYGNRQSQQPVKPMPNAVWRSVSADVSKYRRDLVKSIFCAGESPKDMRQIRASIRGQYDAEYPYATYID